MAIKLDLSQFKHVKSDKNSTTLQHKDGHQLTLAHKSLSTDSQAQLHALSKMSQLSATPQQVEDMRDQKMAEGGKVPPKQPEQKIDYNQVRDEKRQMNNAEANKPKLPLKKYADGGDVQDQSPQVDVGGVQDIVPMQDKAPEVPKQNADVQKMYNQIQGQAMGGSPTEDQFNPGRTPFLFGPNGEPPQSFSPQAWQTAEDQTQMQQVDAAGKSRADAAKIQADNEVRARAGIAPIVVPGVNVPDGKMQGQQPNQTQPQAGSVSTQPQSGSPNLGMDETEGMLRSGFNQQAAGIQAGAVAQGALGQQEAAALAKNQQAQQNAQLAYKQNYDNLEAERQAHMQDIRDGYIDPNKYWESHSKIASAIGMLLGGFQPGGGQNGAASFIQHQMDNNLSAQKSNLDSKQNLLAANLKQFGNLKDATDMTRLMQNDIMQNEIAQAAAKAKSPLAQAAAQQAIGQLKMTYAPLAQQFAMRRAMMSIANNPSGDPHQDVASATHMVGYMRAMGNLEGAKEWESRIVPGIGVSPNQPVPQEMRQQLVATKSVNDLMNRSLEFSAAHRGSLDPSTISQAHTIQNQLIGVIKQAQHDGVYKPSEAEFLVSQIGGSPASFLANMSSVPKIKELQQIKQQEYNNMLSSVGIKPQALAQPSETKTVTKDGVTTVYKRGPNNEAVVVSQTKAK